MMFSYISLGNSFPYLKDNVASISVSPPRKKTKHIMFFCGGAEGPGHGVLADCQNKHTRNKLRQAATGATSVLS